MKIVSSVSRVTQGFRVVASLALAALLVSGCGGCSQEPAPPAPVGPPPFTLCMDASANLNLWEGSPRTLPVRVFQLSTLDGFARADVSKLFESQVSLPGIEGGFIDRQVHPGGRLTLEIQPHPSARYLGVVAGYFRLADGGSAKYYRTLPTDPYASGAAECVRLGANSIEAL